MELPRIRYGVTFLLIAALYAAAGHLALMLAYVHPSASAVWPPSGIAVALLAMLGVRYWPAILIGAFAVNAPLTGFSFISLSIAAGNTAEAMTAAIIIQSISGRGLVWDSVNGVLKFTFLAGMMATLLSATTGVVALFAGGMLRNAFPPEVWFTWWLGDMTGVLVFTPLLILWSRDFSLPPKVLQAETALLAISTALLGILIFGGILSAGNASSSLAYLLLVPILWAAMRVSPRMTAAIVFALSCIAIAGTLRGQGPFAVMSPNTSLLLLQSFMGVAAFTGMLLAAAVCERRAAEQLLESRVAQRTQELALAREQDRANLYRMRNSIDQMTIATAMADDQLRVLHANARFRRLFCTDAHGGATDIPFLPDILRSAEPLFAAGEQDTASLCRMLEEKVSRIGSEFTLCDGTILLCDYVPVMDNGLRHGHLLLCRDITEERRIDRAKSEFMSLTSHQLRTPLTRIRWAVNRLTRMAGLNEDHLAVIDITRVAAEDMANTVSTMLTIARIEAGTIVLRQSRIPLRELLTRLHTACIHDCLLKSQTLRTECVPPLIFLANDEQMLTEILLNLMRNAVKYTPEGGMITVRAIQQGGSVQFDVEDTGIGIPAAEQAQVFRKFFRARNARDMDNNGTGLGLYLASIASGLLQGSLSFVSAEGKGTIFTLVLPLEVEGQLEQREKEKMRVAV